MSKERLTDHVQHKACTVCKTPFITFLTSKVNCAWHETTKGGNK